MKTIGIYKITSPSGKVYIGQSRNIEVRFRRYKRLHKSNGTQIVLTRSFKKYGVDKHTFEIIEECKFEELNKRERYWQDHYDVLGPNGLNCILQETDELPRVITEEARLKRSGKNHFMWGKSHSEESKEKMSKSALGRKASKETKEKLKKIRKGKNNPFYNKTHTKESKKKMSTAKKGKQRDNETVLKISKANKGKKKSNEHIENIRKSKLGDKNPMFGKTGSNHPNSKKVYQYDLDNNFVKKWENAKQASDQLNINYCSINNCCRGKQNTAGKFIWKYDKL